MEFEIKTPQFEGPLDLLLDLVTERKLFISDISLAAVTDDFIRYIEEHDEFPLDESAEFIVIASTLMLIKSRSLLPGLMLSEEEEESITDLESRLALYAKTKELSAVLSKLYGKRVIFEKEPRKTQMVVFSPDSKTNLPELKLALLCVLESLPKKEVVPKAVVKKIASLEETIERLLTRVSAGSKMGFKEFARDGDKYTIIVGFLAMLELVKRGMIMASQETMSSEIHLERRIDLIPN